MPSSCATTPGPADLSVFDPKSLQTTAIIAGLVAIGPLATDMYLPAFPQLMREFGSSMDQVQQTLSVFLVGFALAQLVYGPLSDRYGRKPVLLGGLLLFLASSIGAATADSMAGLTLLRLLQALGGSAGPVLGRAMIRDIHGPTESARLLSYIGTAMALAPAIAPILGGYMTSWLGWASIFLFLSAYAALGILLLGTQVPETMLIDGRHLASMRRLLHNYGELLRHRLWPWYTLTCSFVFAGLFSFLSGSPFVIIDYFGYREESYGLFFALIVFGFMAGTLIAGRLVRRMGIDRLIGTGALLAAGGGGSMALLALLRVDSVWAVILPHVIYMVGTGIVMPQAMAGALAPFPEIAGTSSALLGFIQMTLAAAVGVLVGQYHDGTPLSMSLSIGLMGTLTLVSFAVLRYRRPAS
ncbi:MAG TPA: Bcr/CflA family efflux MFS transporter [Sedimenticola thiotaurini]|uniref:Bcr/CflA family efflux transporter n=1 Tax=Sedimenticola thiotaurini TaxID=1543721 RepID=A0A831W7V4_9GAMM|nr:Bcr/CflA family efflux MFS transporter [Sedimenticola thiotaurini]